MATSILKVNGTEVRVTETNGRPVRVRATSTDGAALAMWQRDYTTQYNPLGYGTTFHSPTLEHDSTQDVTYYCVEGWRSDSCD